MLKVDDTTLFASRGKFARVYMEIGISKPLKAGHSLRGKSCKTQYEELNTLWFKCGRYGENTTTYHRKIEVGGGLSSNALHQDASISAKETPPLHQVGQETQSSFGA